MMACESERQDPDSVCERNVKKDRGGEGGKEEEGGRGRQPLLLLGNKPLQPPLQKLAPYVHYYPEQMYTAWLAHSSGRRGEGWSTIRRNERKQRRVARGEKLYIFFIYAILVTPLSRKRPLSEQLRKSLSEGGGNTRWESCHSK